jgi:hypothetical protein
MSALHTDGVCYQFELCTAGHCAKAWNQLYGPHTGRRLTWWLHCTVHDAFMPAALNC